jgi:hypothetical protein
MAFHAINKKLFIQECSHLDIYLKQKFCDTRQDILIDYIRSKSQTSLYHGSFEALRKWMMDEILLSIDMAERARALKCTLKLAQFFFTNENFAAYFTTLKALEEKAIKRLTGSWYQLSHKYTRWFLQQLKQASEPSYFLDILEERPCFPYLQAIKKAYQNGSEERCRKIEALLLNAHKTIAQQLSFQKEIEGAFFVKRVKLWEAQRSHFIETNFLERSLLLE